MTEPLERVTPISAIFLRAYEHFALVVLVEPGGGGAPTLEAVRERISARLDWSPRLRQRLLPTPLGIAPPLWADDHEFAIEHHVDELAAGGEVLDDEGLRRAVADAFGRRLDLERPPWGVTLLGTLEDGRQALMVRVHHVLASGMTAAALFAAVLFDAEPDAPAGEAKAWRPRPAPGTAKLVALGVRDRLRSLAPGRPRHLGLPSVKEAGGWRALARRARRAYRDELEPRAPVSPLNGPLSERRGYAFAAHDFADVRAVEGAVAEHATVNDVVLATIADGLGRWAAAEGLPVADLRAQVPVSLVEQGQARFGTSTSFMIVDLPVSEPDPLRRVDRVATETAFRKRGGAESIRALMTLSFRLPGPLRSRVLARVTSDRVQNLIVSDIPGPPQRLYFMGGAVTEAFPLMMLSPRHRLRIGAISLGDRIAFGITADPARLADPAGLADAIEASLRELADAAGSARDPGPG